MGDPVRRVPGPLGKPFGGGGLDLFPQVTAFLRDLKYKTVQEPGGTWKTKVSILDSLGILDALKDIFRSENWPGNDSDPPAGNATEGPNAQFPSARRERASRRPGSSPGVSIANPKWSFDRDGLKLKGQAKGTLVIPTPYDPMFDSPTTIDFQLESEQIGPTESTIVGTAKAFLVFKANWRLRVKYNPRQIFDATVGLMKGQPGFRDDIEAALDAISFDFSTLIKAGKLPLSWVQMSASSLRPQGRPLYGATDRLLPVQVAAMPDSRLTMVGGMLLPRGVAFDTIVPGLGFHASQYGRKRGGSITVGGVTYPNLNELGKPGSTLGRMFPVFGHVELKGVQRVSDTIDLGFGLAYSYSPSPGEADASGAPKNEYLPGLTPDNFRGTKHQPWVPSNRDNQGADDPVSKHRLMFRIEGTHDLGGG